MDNRGFTLSELIVTIALLGIILAISFPAITKLQTQNQKKVYDTYEKSLLNAAKLYVDKYGRDLWLSPVTEKKCVIIKYSDLEYEDLVKKFNAIKKSETIDRERTFVLATKINTSVTYRVSLVVKQGSANTYNNFQNPTGCEWQNISGV